ncbi:MAG: LemA family protein [Synergistaceae bacterium]|nr:LemA family protein [Synergistaceae bacterium]
MVLMGFTAIFCLGILILWFIYTFNYFRGKQALIDFWWDEVDMHLKIRHKLIPNLIATTHSRMAAAAPILDKIASIDSRILGKSIDSNEEVERLENDLSSEMHTLQKVFKEHREAQMNEALLTVMSELVSVEGRASSACFEHNRLVNDFNSSITRFPARIVLDVLHFHPREKRVFGVINDT